jgi:Lon protease-like protein
MPLHIFEQRYQDMVRDALESDRRFGMIYHDWDERGPFLSEDGQIGCVAQIEEHRALEDGRSFLIVEGVERFSIDDGIESEALYFEGLVRPYRDQAIMDAEALSRRRSASVELFRAVIASLAEEPDQIPEFEFTEEVSFLLAQTIQVEPLWHQGLLELRDEAERLTQIDEVFRAALG